MKKSFFIIIASLMLISASQAKSRSNLLADFFIGWDGAYQIFKVNTSQTTWQQGMGVGGRLFMEFTEGLDIGVAGGFSHIETHSDISGNLGYLSFLLKYHFTENLEAFGGIGAAMRGTPDYPSDIDNGLILTGGMWNLGFAFALEEGWRIEAMYNNYTLTGTVNAAPETVNSHVFGMHVGKTLDFK